jgi:hypothetical protein
MVEHSPHAPMGEHSHVEQDVAYVEGSHTA